MFPLKKLFPSLNLKLRGYYNYYGVSGNSDRLREFFNEAMGDSVEVAQSPKSAPQFHAGRLSTTCWPISAYHGHGFFAGAVLDYSAGFSMPGPDAETSISEEPGARKRHAGICAGAVRATGRPTAMPDKDSF